MVVVASQRRPSKSSHEFSGTGIFKNALKRCATPIVFVPTEAYVRRASTGDIEAGQDDAWINARRSASDPQVKVPARVRPSRPTSLRFLVKMLELFRRA